MKEEKNKKKVVAILGVTASGKSKISKEILKKIDGEIISVDSRQIYKNIPIFSGISKGEEKNHMVGFLEENDFFSAWDFKKKAEEKMEEIWKKNKTPILVGGTTFYFKSVFYENFLSDAPVDKIFRKKISKKTSEKLWEILKKKDEKRAGQIDKNNKQKIIRSLEIINFFGKFEQKTEVLRKDFEIEFLQTFQEKEIQNKNIEKNFRKRMENGLLKEAQDLKKKLEKKFTEKKYQKIFYFFFPKKLEKKVKKIFENLGLCYKNIFRFWDGEIDEKKFIELGILEEQKYAKRQITFLKKFFKNL